MIKDFLEQDLKSKKIFLKAVFLVSSLVFMVSFNEEYLLPVSVWDGLKYSGRLPFFVCCFFNWTGNICFHTYLNIASRAWSKCFKALSCLIGVSKIEWTSKRMVWNKYIIILDNLTEQWLHLRSLSPLAFRENTVWCRTMFNTNGMILKHWHMKRGKFVLFSIWSPFSQLGKWLTFKTNSQKIK